MQWSGRKIYLWQSGNIVDQQQHGASAVVIGPGLGHATRSDDNKWTQLVDLFARPQRYLIVDYLCGSLCITTVLRPKGEGRRRRQEATEHSEPLLCCIRLQRQSISSDKLTWRLNGAVEQKDRCRIYRNGTDRTGRKMSKQGSQKHDRRSYLNIMWPKIKLSEYVISRAHKHRFCCSPYLRLIQLPFSGISHSYCTTINTALDPI